MDTNDWCISIHRKIFSEQHVHKLTLHSWHMSILHLFYHLNVLVGVLILTLSWSKKVFYKDREYLKRVVRKPFFGFCENKDADQLCGNRKADQRLCFRYIDSTIPLLPKYKITSL